MLQVYKYSGKELGAVHTMYFSTEITSNLHVFCAEKKCMKSACIPRRNRHVTYFRVFFSHSENMRISSRFGAKKNLQCEQPLKVLVDLITLSPILSLQTSL